MTEEKGQSKWLCLGKSVRGASHERSGLPNQDAISWWSEKAEFPQLGEGSPLFLAVSDGHGSSKSFRSDVGSQKAVATATKVMRDFFLEGQSDLGNFSTIKDMAQNSLPKRIVHEWKQSVKQHWTENPVTEQEWEGLIEKDGIAMRQTIEREWKRIMQQEDTPTVRTDHEHNYPAAYGVYGATLLAVLVTESFILYLQIGDGDILCIDSKEKPTRPLERDSRLIANETTSLCTPNAWGEFKVSLIPYQESPLDKMPALILVATDGYSNSYPSEEEFVKIGQDYRQMIKQNGITYVGQQLEGFLKETSEGGSGDDITLGIIRRVEPGDRDDYNIRLTSVEQKGEVMTKQLSDIHSQINPLSEQQKKTNKDLFQLLIGLIVTFSLAVFSIVISGVLYFRLNQVDSKLETTRQELKTKLEEQQK